MTFYFQHISNLKKMRYLENKQSFDNKDIAKRD